MNRRQLLSLGGQAAIGMMAAQVALGSSRLHLHPAIQANIDYWMKVCPEWLSECPPFHVSHYAVKEHGQLRVYAVRWHGSDLNNHTIWNPSNEKQLIAVVSLEIQRQSETSRQGMDIGDTIYCSDGLPYSFCSYVFDSPLRRIKRWGGSLSTCLLAYRDQQRGHATV